VTNGTRPNILWVLTDEQRYDSVGYSGTPWASTPNLDRISQDGVRFCSGYTPSPVCIAARASMLTGRAPSSVGVLGNRHALTMDNPGFLTWEFARSGYQLANFGKVHYSSKRKAFDLEEGYVLGDKVAYEEFLVEIDNEEAGVVQYGGDERRWIQAGRFPGTLEGMPGMMNVRDSLKWVDGRDPERPFFLRLSLNAPHTPVVTPEPFNTMIDPDSIDIPIDFPDQMENRLEVEKECFHPWAGTQRSDTEQIKRMRQCYYGHVAFVDHACGVLFDELEEKGLLENTIIVYAADHGTVLGDHGFFQKQTMYDPSSRVPFFFRWPKGIDKGKEVKEAVSISSLLPTLLDLADIPVPDRVEYPSLAPVLTGTSDEVLSKPVFTEIDLGTWRYREGDRSIMIRDGKWKLALFRDPRNPTRLEDTEDAMMFDLETDPLERNNLANDQQYSDIKAQLKAKIDEWDSSREIREPGQ